MDKKELERVNELFNELGVDINKTKKGAYLLLITDEKDQTNTWAGRDSTLRSMIHNAMQHNEDFASMIIDVATSYIMSVNTSNELQKNIN
jgi:hypothetical protein